MKILENVPISALTTMRLGGKARYVIEITDIDDVRQAFRFAAEHKLPVWMMGGGANTIGRDEGFAGVIILNRLKGIFISRDSKLVNIQDLTSLEISETEILFTAYAGENWDNLVAVTCNLGFSGIEALSMIPGTVGAAPVQNIGAYGQDIAAVIEQVKAYDRELHEFTVINAPDMKMKYRHTIFNHGKDAGRYFIISVTLRLHKGSLRPPFYNSLQKYVDDMHETNFSPANIRRMICEIRSKKLPDSAKVASAGSFFKNVLVDQAGVELAKSKGIPVWPTADGGGKINSGWLIEACGLKGAEFYGFKVSDQASLVLINESARSYADLAQAREKIITAVADKFGYKLEQEPVEIPTGATMI